MMADKNHTPQTVGTFFGWQEGRLIPVAIRDQEVTAVLTARDVTSAQPPTIVHDEPAEPLTTVPIPATEEAVTEDIAVQEPQPYTHETPITAPARLGACVLVAGAFVGAATAIILHLI